MNSILKQVDIDSGFKQRGFWITLQMLKQRQKRHFCLNEKKKE